VPKPEFKDRGVERSLTMRALLFSVDVPRFLALKVLGSVWKSLYHTGPLATIRLAEVPEPTLPSPEWVKIRTRLCGFCGSDQNLILLRDSPTASPFTSFPCIPGHELSGDIVEAGSAVGDFRPGDRVCIAPGLPCATRGIDPPCPPCRAGRYGACENTARGSLAPGMFTGICRDVGGGFAPLLAAHRTQVFRLPDGVSYREGALMEPFGVTLQAVRDNLPGDGDRVLVIGGGVIGNLLVQSIRALGIGCPLAVAEPSRFHGERCLEAGADHWVGDGDLIGAAERHAGARRYRPLLGQEIAMGGFTKVFDAVGHQDTIRAAMRVLAGNGVLSVVGIGSDVTLDPTPLWLKLQTIRGVYGHGRTDLEGRPVHVFETALRLAREKKVRLEGMITHTLPIEEFREMIRLNADKAGRRAVKTAFAFE
jgi:threonine dehydrogenase-like Zn-dependent dehydrogenase